jgi:hypothetical protein
MGLIALQAMEVLVSLPFSLGSMLFSMMGADRFVSPCPLSPAPCP